MLSAIACHTTGKPGMSRLDKILYLADMTSKERDWPGVNKLRRLERKDLDLAMLAALKRANDFVLSEGKPLDPMSKAAYDEIRAEVDARAAKAGEPVFLHTSCAGKEYRLQIVGKNAILWNMTTVSVGIKKLEEPNE